MTINYPRNIFTCKNGKKINFEEIIKKINTGKNLKELPLKKFELVCFKLYHKIEEQLSGDINYKLSDDSAFYSIGNIIRLPKKEFLKVVKNPFDYYKYAFEDTSIFTVLSLIL